MSHKIDRAHPGEQVELAVEVDNGDGLGVMFSIQTAEGEVLDTVSATVAKGSARGSWKVDAKDKQLPLDVTFRASAGGSSVQSGSLRIEPPGTISTPAWILLAADGPSSSGGELTLLDAHDGLVAGQHPEARIPYRGLRPGDEVGLLVDVNAPDGGPLVGNFDLTFELHKEQTAGKDDYALVKTYTRALSAPEGVTQVAARWTMDATGLAPPYHFRFVVSWKRRPGEQSTPADHKSPLTSVPA
ncbi:MAG: hypothetical protein JNL83_04175 [Myxococcales bacterium]|nr:hypothetical protein [Myxococcales bacterium]